MQTRNFQLPVLFLLLVCGVLVSATIDHGTANAILRPVPHSAIDAPVFSIQYRPGHLNIEGTAASSAHESRLLQIVTDQFAGSSSQTSFVPGVALAEQWENASTQLLYVLATTESAKATMHEDRVKVRGVTSDADMLASQLGLLRESMGDDATIDHDFIVIETSASVDALCLRNLSHAVTEPVSFRQSSTEIRTSSYAVLDKIIEVADDCRDSTIAITGHSDSSGNETWNRRLSVARAQAVADYITRGGITPARLLVEGLGSAVPIADNATAQGRSINRRIEFELRQPSLGIAGTHQTE
jgi:OOP family OmpA-OmpF porin